MASAVAGPMSRIMASPATASTAATARGAPDSKRVAVTASMGSSTSQPASSARPAMARAASAMARSHSDLPTPTPRAYRKVFAMPPPIISTSTRPTRLPSTSSLVETLAPPTIAATGRRGLPSAASSASSSACISRPA